MKFFGLLILTAMFMFGCVVDQGKIAIDIKRKIKEPSSSSTNPANLSSASVSNVRVINNQLVISGAGLNSVTTVKVNGNSLNQNFTIESVSATQIIANAVNAFSFDVSKVFDLVLSNANAAATFPIDFSLCNATLNGKGFNCAVSASDKDVLSFDAVSNKWKPRSINGLTYQGSWDAHDPEPAGASAGDYYIVGVANSPYAVGDWIVWNGSAYDKISNSTTITSVFGRTGAVVATKGDYDLNKLTDIDLTVPPTIGKVLKYDGSKWVAGDDLSGGGAGSVTSAEIVNGAVTDAKIDTVSASKITGTITSAQIADGTIVNADISATAAIDYSKINIPNTTIPYAKLNIADGDIPAVKISGLPSATSILTTSITNNDTTHAPDGNAVYDALATKLNTTGGTLTVGTITGVPTPVNPGDVASKSYVDATIAAAVPSLDTDDVPEGTNYYFTEPRVRSTVLTGLNTGVAGPITATDTVLSAAGKLQYQLTDLKANGQWTKTGNDIAYSAGNVTVDKTFILKDSTTNTISLRAPSSVTSYTLTLPPTAGTNDYVLKTDGAGVLSWTAVTDASVQAFAKSTLPTCSTGEVLKSNGTTFSCVTDATGAGSFTGTVSKAVATDASGGLTTSTTSSTELGYVAGVTSSIQTQLNAKEAAISAGTSSQYYKGDKSWATLDTSAVTENTNLYFTAARAKSATVADSLTDGVTDVAPSQNAVYDALTAKLNTTGGTLTVGTISGVPTPTNPSDVVNKAYVDSLSSTVTGLTTTDIAEGTNYYFTDARVRGAALTGLNTGVAGPITATDTVLSSAGKLQYQITDLKANGQWTKTGNDIAYSAGNVTVDKTFILKDSTTNTISMKAPSAVTSYTMTWPATAGTNNYVLKTDGAGVLSWAAMTDTSVQAFAKSALPACTAGQVLKSDGTNFSCVSGGAPAFSGTVSRAIATDSGGALTVSATTSTELGYVSGVTGSIQTQLDSKQATIAAGTSSQYYRGDKTWADLDTSVVTENSNLYFTQARAIASSLTGFSATNSIITAADTILQGFNKAQGQISAHTTSIASKADVTNVAQTITTATVTGLSSPLVGSDAANKTYVDSQVSGSIGSGSRIPASTVMLMQTCPSGWSTAGTVSGAGPGSAICGGPSGTICAVCQSPAAESDLPASSVVLMENCPAEWTALGIAAGAGSAGLSTYLPYVSCQSPASSSRIPLSSKIFMGITCPSGWIDHGQSAAGATTANSTLGNHHVCQAPGPSIPARSVIASSGGSALMQSGAGPTSGAINVLIPASTEGIGATMNLSAGSGGTATSTSRDGGAVNISAGHAAGNGKGGNVTITAGNLSGTGTNGNILLNNGNVGIGVTTPVNPLQLGDVFSLQQDINSGYIGANFGGDTNGTYIKNQYANQIHFDSATGHMNFRVAPSGTAGNVIPYSTPMIIYPSGDISMGVTSPVGSLNVGRDNPSGWNGSIVSQAAGSFAGNAGAPHFTLYRTRGTIASPANVQSGDYLGGFDFVGRAGAPVIGSTVEAIATENWNGTSSGSAMIFRTTANTTYNSPVERMRIDQNGRISLGNITPEVQLHATGAASFSKMYTTGNNLFNTSDPYAADLVIGSYVHSNSVRHDSSIMFWSAGSASRIYLNNDTFYFSQWSQHPTSGANISLPAAVGDTAIFRGPVSAVSYATTSDRRLKKNIVNINNALEKILGLHGVEFDWIRDGKHEVGLIAQEVEEIEPNLVLTHDDGFKGVKYANIVALLIEAMKIENKKIEDNIAMMKTMQSTVADHGRRLASIEKELATQKKTNEKLESENKMMKAYLCSKDKRAPFCH